MAAILVLLYHHFELFGPGITTFHGYLAVDFFFILSGFVVGYAYDDRWKDMGNPKGMSLWAFFKRRLVRLHPMLIFGMFFGMLMFYFGMGDILSQIRDAHWPIILVSFIFAILLIPVPKAFEVRGWGELNSFNGNAWTLVYEYLANILYALFIRRFNKTLLAVLVAVFAILTLGIGLNIDFFGVMGNRSAEHAYTFIGGWDATPTQLVIGWSRLLYPFFAGLLMARCMAAPQHQPDETSFLHRHGFLAASVVLMVVLLMPFIGGENHKIYNGIYEVCCILFVFPVIVYMGAKGTVSGGNRKFCKWLGDISYPLYITHSPIIFTLCIGWKANNPGATTDQIIFVCVCSVILSFMVAWGSLKLWDEPVRAWLKEHWLKR